MSRARIAKIVRQFLENGLKLLLENPHNVHDLLGVAHVEVLELIDFDHLTVVPTTFVQRDYAMWNRMWCCAPRYGDTRAGCRGGASSSTS